MKAREALLRRTCSARTSRRSCRSSARALRLGDVRQRARVPRHDGRSLPHAILMMIPEPWQNHEP
jgi:hypothetical protein